MKKKNKRERIRINPSFNYFARKIGPNHCKSVKLASLQKRSFKGFLIDILNYKKGTKEKESAQKLMMFPIGATSASKHASGTSRSLVTFMNNCFFTYKFNK